MQTFLAMNNVMKVKHKPDQVLQHGNCSGSYEAEGVTADAACGAVKIFNPSLEVVTQGVTAKQEIKRAQ